MGHNKAERWFEASPPLVVERDDGKFSLGVDDETAGGPFESRHHAQAVWLKPTRHQHHWCRR
jgi:hypothetical protein